MNQNALYLDVSDSIRDEILACEYVENEPLPSERYLSEKFHVSRSTIRQALEKLKHDGYIYTVPGNGSFVKPTVFEQTLNHFYTFTDELKTSDTQIMNAIIDYEEITLDAVLSSKLNYPKGTVFHKLMRLRSEKDYPLMIETTYLPKARIHKLDIDYLEGRGSLYKFLEQKYDFKAQYAKETFKPVLATGRERELLHIASSVPCMLLERFSYEDEHIIEYTKSIVRGDKYIFKVTFTPDSPPTNPGI